MRCIVRGARRVATRRDATYCTVLHSVAADRLRGTREERQCQCQCRCQTLRDLRRPQRAARDETRRAACGLRIPLFSAPLLNSTRLNSDLIHLISSLKWPRRSRFPLGQTAVRARDSIAMAIRRHTMLLSARRTRHTTHDTRHGRLGSARLSVCITQQSE